VLIGRHPSRQDLTTIDADNVRGTAMAVQHLARLGHTRIATITGPLGMVVGIDRRDGFLAGMRSAGLTCRAEYIVEGDFTELSGNLAMQRLLALPVPPQAVFAASDIMAIGAVKALRAAGKRVPEDVALVGYDDIPIASAVEPALTTIRQPIEQLGFTAASVLIDTLQSNVPNAIDSHGAPQRIVLPTELIVRQSCGQSLRFHTQRSAPAHLP
jgi:LacI family transcriptional regulator